MLAGCSPAATRLVTRAQRLQLPDPAPGSVNVAVLSFDLDAGVAPPVLARSGGYHPAPTAAFVGGLAKDPSVPNGYLGLVAIADFQGPGQAHQRASAVDISASQEFSIDYVGNAAYAAHDLASVPALASHGAWTLAWHSVPAGAPALAGDPGGLLDEIAALLQGTPSPQLVAVLAGLAPPPVALAAQPAPTATIGTDTTGPTLLAGPPAPRHATGASSPGPSPTPVDGQGPSPAPSPASSPSPSPSPTPSPSPAPSPSPSPAPSGPVLTATVVSLSRGPFSLNPRLVLGATTGCPQGGGVVVQTGGGVLATSAQVPNGLMINGSAPVGPGPDSTSWQASAEPATGTVGDAGITTWAICLTNGPVTNLLVSATVMGPSAAVPQVTATAVCPSGFAAIGGGGSVGENVPSGRTASVTLTASVPSGPDGTPVTSGSASAWSALGVAGTVDPVNPTTSAFVLCFRGGRIGPMSVVTATPTTNPVAGIATCPAGTVLLSGGFQLGAPGYLEGAYPSVQAGLTQQDGPVLGSWTALASPGADPEAFALCSG